MPESISDSYLDLNKALHSDSNFGSRANCGGLATKLHIALLRLHEKGVCDAFIDYGCGKGNLVMNLRNIISSNITIDGYDPAIDQFNQKPTKSYDFLSCFDVLEHIEDKYIDNVLDHIRSLAKGIAYIAVDLQPAVKKLENGRNAHILLAPPDWWTTKIAQYFSSQISFPIKHSLGFNQKIVFFCSNNIDLFEDMLFVCKKLKAYNISMMGGLSKPK